jgi:hypothetical protein
MAAILPVLTMRYARPLEWTMANVVIALLLVVAGIIWASSHYLNLDEAIRLAPLGTASLAFLAAYIALIAMLLQRDTARRRAAIDFFLKTEMDDGIIAAYENFQDLTPKLSAIVARPDLARSDKDYRTLRKWLDICELIAVGVNLGAFSEKVSRDYWGYVLPESWREAELLILHIRQTKGLGSNATYCELEKLVKKRKWRVAGG